MSSSKSVTSAFSSVCYTCIIVCLSMGNLTCSNTELHKPKVYYIIGQEKVSSEDRAIDPSEPPPPPLPFYGEINLILYGKSDVYLHRVTANFSFDADDRPIEVALTKWDLRRIELTELPQFLAEEYKDVSPKLYRQYFTCIKSKSDTITNEAFPKIKLFFESIKFDKYIVRKWTDHEQEAIESIERN